MRLLAAILFGIWLLLMLLGKGGFIYLLFLGSIGLIVADSVAVYRNRMTP